MDPLFPLSNTTNTRIFAMNRCKVYSLRFKGTRWNNTQTLLFDIFAWSENLDSYKTVAVIMAKQDGPTALLEPDRVLPDGSIGVTPCVYVWPDTNEVCFDNFNRPQYQPLMSFVHPAQQLQFTQSWSRYDSIFLHSQFLRLISGLH